MSFMPVTPGGSALAHLESDTEDEAWTKLLVDASHMPYDGKQGFIDRGYTVFEVPDMTTVCSQKECMETGCAFPDCLDEDSRKRYDACEGCRRVIEGDMYPSHSGSKQCESGSIASGGKNSHCTCDVCF